MKRRTLLSLAAAGPFSSMLPAWAAAKPKPLKILILGGTRFIGLHMTALALERGHVLTFFNRGKTKTDRYPDIERIKGDRNGEIDGLKDREWDAVRSEEHTSELQSPCNLVCRLLLEKKKTG